MREWTAPMAVVEQFVPNDYVAACYTVKCGFDVNYTLEEGELWYWIKESNGKPGCQNDDDKMNSIDGFDNCGKTLTVTDEKVMSYRDGEYSDIPFICSDTFYVVPGKYQDYHLDIAKEIVAFYTWDESGSGYDLCFSTGSLSSKRNGNASG